MKKKILFVLLFILLSTLIITIVRGSIVQNILLVNKMTKCRVVTENVDSAVIPFTIEKGWLVIELQVKNKDNEYRKDKFILDTGAPTCFTAPYVTERDWAVKPIVMQQIALGGDRKETKAYLTKEAVQFGIGNIELEQDHVLVNDMELASMDCIGAKGLIGSNMLSKFIVTFDFVNNTVTLHKKQSYNYSEVSGYKYKIPFFAMPFQKNPMCTINVNGEDFFGVFDSGFSGSVLLKADSTKTKVKELVSHPDVIKYDTYGVLSNINGVVKESGAMYLWEDAVFLNEDDDSLSAASVSIIPGAKNDLTMGLKFASQFEQVVIDWKKNDIYCMKEKAQQNDNDKRPVIIRHLEAEQQFVIGVIETGSSFYKNGLRSKDIVVAINNTLLSDIGKEGPCELTGHLNDLTRNASYFVVQRGGETVTINK